MRMQVGSLVDWGSDVAMSCGVGCRHGLDPERLWLWPAAAALIQPLGWEPPHAASAALKRQKKKKKKKRKKERKRKERKQYIKYVKL